MTTLLNDFLLNPLIGRLVVTVVLKIWNQNNFRKRRRKLTIIFLLLDISSFAVKIDELLARIDVADDVIFV